MTTIYYAHCIALYDTPQEERDIETLKKLKFTVVNPNTHQVNIALEKLPQGADKMQLFQHIVLACDALAFRALPDGSIPAGVAKEVAWAQEAGLPVIELPSSVSRRAITIESTREYLREVGLR
jgi:hypothetical protein